MTRRSEQLERQAERTRAQLVDTLEELRDRMSPARLADEFMDFAQEGGAAEFTRDLGRDIRADPLPMTLVAAGLAWLFMKNARLAQDDRAGEEAGGGAEAIAGSRGRGASDRGRDLLQLCREQPILMAGLGLAAGALVGALLSSTETGKRLAEEGGDAAADGAKREAARRPDKARDLAAAGAEARSAALEGLGAPPPAEQQIGARPVTHH